MIVPYPRWPAEHCSVFHFPRTSEGILIVNFTVNKEGLTSAGHIGEEFIAEGSRSRHEPMERASRSKHSQCPARVTGRWRQCRKRFCHSHAPDESEFVGWCLAIILDDDDRARCRRDRARPNARQISLPTRVLT